MKPVAAAVAASLISGAAMYTVGARTATVDAFTQTPAVQTLNGQGPAVAPASTYAQSLRPVARPAARSVAARRTAYRSTAAPSQNVYREETRREDDQPTRSWQKTAMIIGGSTAGGAGIGGIMGGKKGALIGAAIGGGASTIYEASRRR